MERTGLKSRRIDINHDVQGDEVIICRLAFSGYWGRLTATYECTSKNSSILIYESKISRFASMIGMESVMNAKYDELKEELLGWHIISPEIDDFISTAKDMEKSQEEQIALSRVFGVIKKN